MKKVFAILSIILMLVIMQPVPLALADQSNPDSTPSAEIYCYRNMLETGDFGVFIKANIPYAVEPDEPVTSAFIWRLIDTDNVTELGSTTGYAFTSGGYGYNVFWLYFAASEGLVWESSYTVRLSGNPAIFNDPPIYNFVIDAADYSPLTATADVKAELASRILITAADLDAAWGLSYSLLSEQETGTVLSIYGESVFRGAIYGVQALAPAVFYVIVGEITAEDRTWSPDYATNLTSQYTGTWVADAQAASTDFFGSSYDLLSVILIVICLAAVFVGNIWLSKSHWSALIDVSAIAILLSRLSISPELLTFVCVVAAVCWIYTSGRVWGVWT